MYMSVRRTNLAAWWVGALAIAALSTGCPEAEPSSTDPNNDTVDVGVDQGVDLGQDADGVTPDAGDDVGDDTGDDAGDAGGGPTCEDECGQGEQVCDGDVGYRLCGQYDTDPCLELSPSISCAQGYTCGAGRCAPDCRDTCPVGGTLCLDRDTVQICGNFDTDICRESGAGVDCRAGERCEAGECVDENAACVDECSTDGDATCYGDAVRSCGNFDQDSCLDLGPPVACLSGQSCSAGECVAFCADECPAAGVTECLGDGVRTCGEFDQDACLEWSAPEACEGSESCSDGECSEQCADECSSAGVATCSADASGVALCGDYDSDSCLDLASPIPCPGGFSCSGGVCVASCTDECTSGQTRCAADGSGLESCGDYDSDPCAEFGGAVMCPGGATCSAGACDIACTDGCSDGVSECVDASTARTCGQFDLDACVEWSQPTTCASHEVCDQGGCVLGVTPDVIVINELVYDSLSVDTADGNSLFVELSGPAGASLDGWELIGVDGNGGTDYRTLSLSGEVIAQDGYFVIAHPRADPDLLTQADITSSSVDWQNGPDSVQLRWRGRVVDALGYGVFGAQDSFAGEGAAAAPTSAGSSLSRDASRTDTDDNASDFTEATIPTPRDALLGCVDECVAGAERCDSDLIQTCGDFDADSCLEYGASAACPMAGQTCQGGACADPCVDECTTQGGTQCLGDNVITCGDYDADSCLEYSQAVACPMTERCVVDQCQSASAPEVVLIAPQGRTQTTQGNPHRILVDPTPAPGRGISQVDFYANGAVIDTVTAAPYETNYVVPAATPTDTSITLQAKAIDDAGEVGVSAYGYLDVRNDFPVAAFTATITNTSTVTVDATASSDTETAAADLEVCWDWDNDNTCDTPFATDKIVSHDYGQSGTYTVRMVTRDQVGQTSETTRDVSFSDIQYLGGADITTTLWYGTIIVTGDLRVPAGEVLTIAPNTNILFVRADIGGDGVGDYTLTVEGSVIINGTAAEPVVFSGQDANAKVPGGWDRVIIDGDAPSTFTHAIVEYADVGLDVRDGSTFDFVTVRSTLSDCVLLQNADGATFTDTTITQCGADGVHATTNSTGVTFTRLSSTESAEDGVDVRDDSAVAVTDATLSDNGASGASVTDGATFDLQDANVTLNLERGLYFSGDVDGTISQNDIHDNGAEGVGFFSDATGHPDPVVQKNNIYSNATVGSSQVGTVSESLSMTCGYCPNIKNSSVYRAPAGSTINRVRLSFNDGTQSQFDTAWLIDADTGSTLWTRTSDFNGWVFLPEGVAAVNLRLQDTGYSDTETFSMPEVDLLSKTGADDISSYAIGGTIDGRFNYLGTFPDVLSRVGMNRAVSIDLQGFVGVAFGPTWDTGPYLGGQDVVGGTWPSVVYVTGDVTVPAGVSVSVSPGTQILFIDHDQDLDGEGDWSISASGNLAMNGAVGNEIDITGYGNPAGDVFQTVEVSGSGVDASMWQDVTIAHGKVALTVSAGDSVFERVAIEGASSHGVVIDGGSTPSLTQVDVDGAGGNGFEIDGASPTISKADCRNNDKNGMEISNGGAPDVMDSVVRDNGEHGVLVSDSNPTIRYNLLTYNGIGGLWFVGSGSPVAEYNVIKFNDDVGVGVFSSASGTPTPTVQFSNIYSNATVGSSQVGTVSESLSMTCGYCPNIKNSSVYRAPAGSTINRVRLSFNDGTQSQFDTAWLIDADTGSTLWTRTSDFNGWVFLPEGVAAVNLRLQDTGYSDTETFSMPEVDLLSQDIGSFYELVAATTSGVTTAKFNYWTPTIGDVPQKISETRPGAVDYTGFTGSEYPNQQVTEVGPRP